MPPQSTTARGYGTQHQTLRKTWAPLVEQGAVTCPRCARPITPGQAWDLGHHDTDRTRYTGPEHQRCNRAAGADARATGHPSDAGATATAPPSHNHPPHARW
jgi:hypothetical protein